MRQAAGDCRRAEPCWRLIPGGEAMSIEDNKRRVRDFIEAVWVGQDLGALNRYWTPGCVNHAAPPGHDAGLAALRAYHEQFAAQFSAFSDLAIDLVQQVGEGDTVLTHLLTSGRHSGDFAGMPATGRVVSLVTMRVDRLEDGMIAEHWSVADVAGLMTQLQG
jgi:predicted ester cyclase